MTRVTTPRARGALHLPLNTLALRRGGLIKAVMLRANALAAAEPQRPVVIEVLAFQPRLEEDVADLVARGFLDPRVHVRSVLRAIAPDTPPASVEDPIAGCVHTAGAPAGSVPPPHDPRAVVLAEPPRPPGQLRRRRLHDDQGRLRYVDVMDAAGRRLLREEYGTGDRLLRVQAFRPGERQPVAYRWLGADGRAYLVVWQEPGDRFWGAAHGVVNGTFESMPTPQDMYRGVFEQLLRTERAPVLFSEFRDQLPNLPGLGFDPVVPAIRHPTLRRVAVAHSNHIVVGMMEPPFRSSPNFTGLLESLGKWDLLVTATERQKQDIADQYGHPDRIGVIPHFAPDPTGAIDAPVDPNRFVLVARIHKKKRVDEALRVFRLVLDEIPSARLEVYGFGYGDELEARVMALVEELQLGAAVQFKGFVEDPSGIYAGAGATLQTSQSEGFGMALLESLSAGVPVVAYDVRYGAREAIRDGVDGYVVPWGDRRAMADRLLAISRDPDLRARLGAAAPEGVRRFSRARYQEAWQAAIAALPDRVDVSAPPDARVAGGRLHVMFAAEVAGELVARPRGGGADQVAALADGAAGLPLPAAAAGEILDLYVRADGAETRIAFTGTGPSDDPGWQIYTTDKGNLSLKKTPTAAPDGRPRGHRNGPAQLGLRALRRLKRISERRGYGKIRSAGAEKSTH
jgi:poly(glycerol-phosphate) alpha-glucosyltransferase